MSISTIIILAVLVTAIGALVFSIVDLAHLVRVLGRSVDRLESAERFRHKASTRARPAVGDTTVDVLDDDHDGFVGMIPAPKSAASHIVSL